MFLVCWTNDSEGDSALMLLDSSEANMLIQTEGIVSMRCAS
jgi:hypothetical protein